MVPDPENQIHKDGKHCAYTLFERHAYAIGQSV
jgi:hypothetical protein